MHRQLSNFSIASLKISDDGEPLELDQVGQQILRITNYSPLDNYKNLLFPLIELFREAPNSNGSFQSIELLSVDGYKIKCLAVRDDNFIFFSDISSLEQVIRIFNYAKLNRTLIVLASSFLGRAMHFDLPGITPIATYEAKASEFFNNYPTLNDSLALANFQTQLSTALDIIHPLIPPTTKIIVNAKTAALLKISQINFLRLTCHLLLEACDFIGNTGIITINSDFKTLDNGSTGKTYLLEFKINAQRNYIEYQKQHPFVKYFFSQTFPAYFSLSETCNSLKNSENSTIALHLAKNLNLETTIEQTSDNDLKISTCFPLQTDRS